MLTRPSDEVDPSPGWCCAELGNPHRFAELHLSCLRMCPPQVPFGSDANDLDMVKTHLDFCAGLESMLDLAGTCESAKVHGFAHCCDDIGVAAMPKDWAPDSSIFVAEAEASAMADGSGHSNNAPYACRYACLYVRLHACL